MEIQVKYSDLEDRRNKVNEYESRKLRMLHDNFDPDWKPGDEPHGTMIFTDVEPEPAPILKPDWQAEWNAADTTAKKLLVIAKRLGLE